MSSAYIQSNENSHFLAKETAQGVVPPVGAANRVLLSGLKMLTTHAVPKRNDRWGSRSVGEPIASVQKDTSFQFSTYHYENSAYPNQSIYGALIEAALGGDPLFFAGGTVDSQLTANRIRLVAPHNLSRLMAISRAGEVRFVDRVIDANTVEINAPFTAGLPSGSNLEPAFTYTLARSLKTLSLFDYWTPASSIQRVGRGAAVDRMKIAVNGDFHSMTFSGPMIEVLDSLSFTPGMGGLSEFPLEPSAIGSAHEMPVPGHLGQAIIGDGHCYTMTEAEVTVNNGVGARSREFGSVIPRSFVPGRRAVSFSASLYVTDEASTRGLYQYASERATMPVMLQLGDRQGQLLGVYLPSIVPTFPEYDDRENRVVWHIEKCTAHGSAEDELTIGMA
ncbi:MAG: hypothetical protein JST93_31115 [Acidobacteria bacterium]|nr:hypothetical protein [Acidobacteriota bacterium]